MWSQPRDWGIYRRHKLTKKCIEKHGLAYTPDNVLIYNIQVTKIPPKTTQEALIKYFEKIGPLKTITFYVRKRIVTRKSYPTEIHIQFKHASAATKALSLDHMLDNRKLKVEPFDSWAQPGYELMMNKQLKKKTLAVKEIDDYFKTLGTLDDDCLMNIIAKLPMQKAAILAQTSQRFQLLYNKYIKTAYRTFSLNQLPKMTALECYEFFKCTGHVMNSIHVTDIFTREGCIFQFIGKFCTALREFELKSFIFPRTDFRAFLIKQTKLTKLSLVSCSLRPNTLATILHLKNLKELNLRDNDAVTGCILKNISAPIEKLNICDCLYMETMHLCQLLSRLPNLIELDMRGVIVRQEAVNALVESCTNLEVLKVTLNSVIRYESIANLPKLHHLDIHYPTYHPMQLRTELLTALVEKKTKLEYLGIQMKAFLDERQVGLIAQIGTVRRLSLNNMESIDYYSLEVMINLEYLSLDYNDTITDGVLFKLVRELSNLREVQVQQCPKISNGFVNRLVGLLEIPSRPSITVRGSGTKINFLASDYNVPQKEPFKNGVEVNNLLNSDTLMADLAHHDLHRRTHDTLLMVYRNDDIN